MKLDKDYFDLVPSVHRQLAKARAVLPEHAAAVVVQAAFEEALSMARDKATAEPLGVPELN